MQQLEWIPKHPDADPEILGYIPSFTHQDDLRPAREQLDSAYLHAGGWRPFSGFKMLPNGNLQYPGDPPTRLLFEAKLRQETIRFYEWAWIAIIQPDGSFEIAHMN